MSVGALDFLALCRARGVDPNSIPSRGATGAVDELAIEHIPPIGGVSAQATATAILLAYEIGAASRGKELDAIGSRIYSAQGAGALSDADVTLLERARERRRAEQQAKRKWWERCYGAPLKPPRDRIADRDKRRGLVRLGWLPPSIANGLTPGEEAVAAVYAEDFKRKGHCDDTKGQLAVRAGVVERVVQRAQRALAKAGAITITRRPRNKQRHDSTVVVIVDQAWRQWLRNRRVPDRRSPLGVGDCCKGEQAVSVHLLHDTETVCGETLQGLPNGSERRRLKPAAGAAIAGRKDMAGKNGSFPAT
ncbi:hypothetical protein HUU61_10785 [Rhodopseudomonas palustris]|nr:hypothetical protein [Rhodopseudomonas palustris]